MISAIHTAARGIAEHMRSMDRTAERIAKAPLGNDISRNHVQLIMDRHAISMNAKVIRSAYDTTGTLLDILA